MASSGSPKRSSPPEESDRHSSRSSSSSSSRRSHASGKDIVSRQVSPAAEPGPQTSGDIPRQRSGSIPRALSTFRRESSFYQQNLVGEETAEPRSERILGVDKEVQTEASWLHDAYERKLKLKSRMFQDRRSYRRMTDGEKKTIQDKDSKEKLKKLSAGVESFVKYVNATPSTYGPLVRAQWATEPSMQKLTILCNMEFKEDFEMFFEPLLETIPKIGPPTILAYKPEPPPRNILFEWETECSATCEFCGNDLTEYPSLDEIDFDFESYDKFCCGEFRRLHEYISHQRTVVKNMYPQSDLISIAPHAAYGSEHERIKEKEKALRRKQERQLARSFAFVSSEPEEGGKQLRTITYQLSRDPSIKIMSEEAVIDSLKERCVFTIDCATIWLLPDIQKVEKEFLEKYYKHGGKFLTMFPDGTAQIFYPSGNLAAVIMTSQEKGFTCVILDDSNNKPAIRGIFDCGGKVTCYYPNGNIWVNINLLGGQYSDPAGNRLRIWKWASTLIHTSFPLVSFNPIFMSLNHYVGVRILDQDKIIITFLAMGQQARLNVGTKLQVRIFEEVPKMRYFSDEDLFLLALIIKIRRLLSKIEICLNFPTIENWHKLKTPSYLETRAVKLLSLCHYYDLSRDAISAITALLNDPV